MVLLDGEMQPAAAVAVEDVRPKRAHRVIDFGMTAA
jgi:hypothetical protein